MSKGVKGIVIAVICFVVIIALALGTFLVLGLTGVINPFGVFNGGSFSINSNLELANRQVFTEEGFEQISVSYSFEDITIVESDDGTIVLEEYMRNWDESMFADVTVNAETRVDEQITGGQLIIKQGYREWGIFNNFSVQVKLYLPANMLADVKINTSSGTIRSEDSFNFRSFAANTTSGSIRFVGIQAKNEIRLEASSGSVSAHTLLSGDDTIIEATSGSINVKEASAANIFANNSSGSISFDVATAAMVEAKSNSGSIRFEEINGQFNLKGGSGSVNVAGGEGYGSVQTSSGDARVELDEMLGDISLEASSGTCRLAVPQGSAFNFSARTNSGGIRIPRDDADSYDSDDDGEDVTATFGDAPEYDVEIGTSSGDVRLEWN